MMLIYRQRESERYLERLVSMIGSYILLLGRMMDVMLEGGSE